MQNIYDKLPGKFSTNDGTIDFYLRVRSVIQKSHIILDLGAGAGDWFNNKNNIKMIKDIQFIKKEVKKVFAADIDKAVLNNRSSHKNILIKNNKIPLKSNSVDIIISDWTLEHVETPKLFFKEANRVLKKGGKICIRTPHKYNYVSLINTLTEGTDFKNFLLKKSQPGKKDPFKSYYKINTFRDIKKLFKNYQIEYFIFNTDPAYYFNSKIIYNFFKIIHVMMPLFFVGIIYCILTKKKQ